jgi:ATP-dependent Clp protease ATP-binding subunit ClpA
VLSKDLELTLAAAFREAESRRHEYVTLEHLLFAIVHNEQGVAVIAACGGEPRGLRDQLEGFFRDQLQQVPGESPYELELTLTVRKLLDRVVTQVKGAERDEAHAGDVLAAIMLEQHSHAAYFLRDQGITRLDILEALSHGPTLLGDDSAVGRAAAGSGASQPRRARSADQNRDVLAELTVELTERARSGKIDPLIGRDAELERVLQVLGRRQKNNPVLVGDAGVGKTAVVEGLALRIANGQVPEAYRATRIYALDMGATLAGTKFRGEFEARLRGVIDALEAMPDSVLFIDEIHTIVGAGATSGGSLDAANILKPALSGGAIRCIGSTTFEEFRKYFEKDHALSRRFQKVHVEEPSIDETVAILRGLKSRYEEFHDVHYSDRALRDAAEMSATHMPERRLPDKAIDVLDEAGARWKLHAPTTTTSRPDAPDAAAAPERPTGGGADSAPAAISPPPRIKTLTRNDIAAVVASMTGRPVATVSARDRGAIRDLPGRLRERIYGQDAAIAQLGDAIKRSRAGLGDSNKPIGSFLLAGPTGVGKTEVTRQLADLLGVELIRIDMSEYMERHTVSRLVGAPPGYVGYDDGGLLTDAIIKNPHAVVLLDEIEKAHPDVFDLLLQIMDYATLTDANGRKADFHHVVLVMTSNAGGEELSGAHIGFSVGKGSSEIPVSASESAVKRLFRPEFINRLDALITFLPLEKESVLRIVHRLLADLNAKLASKRVLAELTEAATLWLGNRGYEPAFGARPLARLFQSEVADRLADYLLDGARKQTFRFDVAADADSLSLLAPT